MESGFASERIFTDCIQLGMFAVKPDNQNEESAPTLRPF
jgi:hypothetical protein